MDGELVDPAEAHAAVDPFVGVSLPRLDLGAIEAAVGAVPGVREASATRSWPHGLVVEVVERVPVAAIADSGTGYILVDVEGVELASLVSEPTEVPVLTVPIGEDNARILTAALTVAGALQPELKVRVEAVRAETEDSVTLFLKDGPRVEWGSADDTDLKVEVLRVLLNSDAASVAVIDVSAPTLPVTRDR
jgi:cell division protein FtsQ